MSGDSGGESATPAVTVRRAFDAIASTVVEAPMLAPTKPTRSASRRTQRSAPSASGSRSVSTGERARLVGEYREPGLVQDAG